MSREEVIRCDRCGRKSTKWDGPMAEGARWTIESWGHTQDEEGGDFRRIEDKTTSKDLCGACLKDLMALWLKR